MRQGLLLLPALLALAGCTPPGVTGGSDAATAPAALPPGITADQVYTRQPDPRTGPCRYYRVEGFEVLLDCAG